MRAATLLVAIIGAGVALGTGRFELAAGIAIVGGVIAWLSGVASSESAAPGVPGQAPQRTSIEELDRLRESTIAEGATDATRINETFAFLVEAIMASASGTPFEEHLISRVSTGDEQGEKIRGQMLVELYALDRLPRFTMQAALMQATKAPPGELETALETWQRHRMEPYLGYTLRDFQRLTRDPRFTLFVGKLMLWEKAEGPAPAWWDGSRLQSDETDPAAIAKPVPQHPPARPSRPPTPPAFDLSDPAGD